MKTLRSYLADFVSLLFPDLCRACGTSLVTGEHLICTDCRYHLPYTNFHLQADNLVAKQFWGKLPVEAAYSMLYFTKGGKVQQLMHQLKYKNQPQVGNLLGSLASIQLQASATFGQIDLIIPVPLHKSRLRKRGYNQSTHFAEGLTEKLLARVVTDNLIRVKATKTQTKKSRAERAENMQSVFTIKNPDQLIDKNILLVDDIMTTGATLEACGAVLLQVPGVKLFIATIAYTE
ncbi:ComF family protein [Mucilaginibacter yixingensis]|uniref:ComF family protein n=1 Tax=Mucilaginibacter yixingensis TaxID=1295612 RepID=A0A2T5J8P8_9SPHI|nr:ComF family protein [Mucilaginibacter yixingensis]PTQ95826.1 ComF family protein [Mucilaginibacter yixingensis]